MRAMRSRLIRPRVSGVSGQQSTMMSLCSTSASIDRKPTLSGAGCMLRVVATTFEAEAVRGDMADRLADGAEADDADRLAGKFAGWTGVLAAGKPALGAQVAVDRCGSGEAAQGPRTSHIRRPSAH